MTINWKNAPRWIVKTLIKISIIGFILLIAAAIYFDAQIKKKFEGTKWQLPALVYGVEHKYERLQALSRDELIRHLTLLDYRKVWQLTAPGEYRVIKNGVEFIRREYSMPQQQIPMQKLQVTFRKNRIGQIKSLKEGVTESEFSLEPYLLDRLQASNLEDRILVELDQIPDIVSKTLILVEDRKFYDHHGISPLAILRALMVNVQAGRTVQGGSTLTQQLVKNMFLTNERSLVRKFKEAIYAILLDARYSKEQVLQAYLNEVYLGQNHNRGVHGFGLASHYYFAKPLNELRPSEVALLIGIIKGPSYYAPRRFPERAKERRDLVLRLMMENHLISTNLYQHEVELPIKVQDKEKIAKRRYPSYVAQVKRELKQVVNKDIPLNDGIKIFTHFDPLTQNQAQAAVSSGLDLLESQRSLADLQAAMVVVDNHTGGIQAIVGDRVANYDGFNRALDAQRNIGSLVKPAIYLNALQQPEYYNLATQLEDKEITLTSSLGKKWSPKNYDKKYLGQVSLLDALVGSRNVPAVNLGMALGLREVADTLQWLGVEKEVNPYPSMLLGSTTLSPMEVAQIYQVFANAGVKKKINAIKSINAPNNELIWQSKVFTERVIQPEQAYLLNYALHQVTQKGSAKYLGKTLSRINFAGKTGTTNDARDSWFAGFDQSQLAVVWVGNDDNKPIKLTGSSGALRLFVNYQKMRTPSSLVMAKPANIEMKYFDKTTGEHILPGCNNMMMLPAIAPSLAKAKACAETKEWQEPKKSWLDKLFSW